MKLLHIDSSVLGSNSVTRALSAGIVKREQELHSGLEVQYIDLSAQPLQHLSSAHIGALFGHPPEDQATLADIATGSGYIDAIFAANIIVIGAPMYNFTLPSQLKAWIDRILVAGKTFKYGDDGVPHGLVPADKKVFIASARGGAYSEGSPIAFLDHQETLLKAVLGFIGLSDVTIIRAEGVAVPDLKPAAIAAANAEIATITA